MKFVWDNQKNLLNQAKHKVSFEIAQLVFNDPFHLSIQDRYDNDEERWQTIGIVNGVIILLVAHTVKYDDKIEIIRIISARKATVTERIKYESYHSR